MRRFENDLFPWIGKRPIAEIKAPAPLAVLRRIESRGAQETAHRAMQNCGQVFRYAVATGRAERDPTGDLRGALPPPKESITRLSLNRSALPNCSGPLIRTRDSSLRNAPFGLHRLFS